MSGEQNTAWGGAIVLPGCCAEAQENPWKMVHPNRRGAAGAEGVLQMTVKAFHHPVGLRVGGLLAVLDVEQAAQGGLQGVDELGPAV